MADEETQANRFSASQNREFRFTRIAYKECTHYLPKHLRVTDRGMQLTYVSFFGTREKDSHLLHWVYLLETWVFQQTQPSDTEDSMKDIDHITWPVCKTAQLRILHRLDLAGNCSALKT